MIIDSSTAVSVSFLLVIVSTLVSVATFLRTNKKDNKSEIEQNVRVNMKLDQLCNNVDEIRTDIKRMASEVAGVKEKQIAMERDLKTIWATLTAHDNAIDELRGKR